MPTLLLRFPGGRYHATPSGHHVNEGIVEWPPSPWRLLRALIATGYTTLGWAEIPSVGRRLLEALAGALPSYRLPPATLAHSRHYMPLGVFDKGREKTTLVFDSWADVGDGAITVRWPCTLDEEAQALFAELASNLGYLGRSESWVLGESIASNTPQDDGWNAFPHVEGTRAHLGYEQIALTAAETPASYAAWREEAVRNALEPFPLPEGKRPSKKLEKDRARAIEPFPTGIIECLERDTQWWKERGFGQAPGSRRVLYWRPASALSVGAPPRPTQRSPERIEAVLLALTTPSGNRSALPMPARTLPQAELIHESLVSKVGRGRRVDCPELTGKDDVGRPLRGHQHAHVVPLDLDGDGRLDHVVLYARMGFGAEAQAAIRSLQRTWTKGGVGELQVALAGRGRLADLRAIPSPLDSGIGRLLGPEGGARSWRSVTPFVPARFPKRRGSNTVTGQVTAELGWRELGPAKVEILPWDDETRHLRHAVRRRRSPAKPPPVDAGYALRLVFDEPVPGPILLGYGSHFGLGLFAAETGT